MRSTNGNAKSRGRLRQPYLRLLLAAAALLLMGPAARAQNAGAPLRLIVDLQDAPRRILHARLTVPARPGTLSLLYPKWIPGEHAPDGPIADLVGIRFTAGGRTLPWRRDDVNLYQFHIEVPAGADSIEATYDYLSPLSGQGYSAGPTTDPAIAVLEWNLVVLYPAGSASDSVMYAPSVRLPQGWKFASALTLEKQQGEQVDFAPVNLTTLVDSPVLAGEHFRSIALATEVQPPHRLHIAADHAEALEMTGDQIAAYGNLVREQGALFGARHYAHYDFLLALTDNFYPNGLEHHQSSDVRASERMFTNADQNEYYNSLLAHEFTHSWNGKYRRPAGLVTPDFEQPMKSGLLWVYEGLTQYLGEALSARAGLRSIEEYREALAWVSAYLDNRPGRAWRPLADTAVAAAALYDVSSPNWSSWRRSVDFYDEGWLIWLEADMVIRRESRGQKSLDDFCRRFYGGASSGVKVVPYTLDEVLAALNETQPYNWRGFFRERVEQIQPRAPLGGIENGGWRLVYTPTPNMSMRAKEKVDQELDLTFSIGVRIRSGGGMDENGRLNDVLPGSPAAMAGLAPGMQIRSVNGSTFSGNALNEAIRTTQNNNRSITVTANNGGFIRTYEIVYHGGPRYPHLQRNPALPDLLSEALRPRAGISANSN